MRRIVRLDVDHRADWLTSPGYSAEFTVGPFEFGLVTADCIAFGFRIRFWTGWTFGWGVGSPGWDA